MELPFQILTDGDCSEQDTVRIIPLGGGREVGRSCFVVSARGRTVMFDCGVHPAKEGLDSLPHFHHIDTSTVDLCLITHFHLDHSGAVPYFLRRTEFTGKTVMTHPTKPITRLLWLDFARVARLADESVIFSRADIDACCDKIDAIHFKETHTYKGIKYQAYCAGHVLGAAMFLVDLGGIRVLYTGDYSREIDRHLPFAEIPNSHVDVCIIEATYGIQNHEARPQREARLTSRIMEVIRNNGKCLLPVFALGRAQELLLILEELWEQNQQLQEIPIYYISPMASRCLKIFDRFVDSCSDKIKHDTWVKNVNPWDFKHIKNVSEVASHAAELYHSNKPCVVLAAPGMLQNGTSRDLCEAWCSDSRNCILLTGYSVAGTLAHDLMTNPVGITSISSGKTIPVRCGVKFLSFSAHADYRETLSFLEALRAPNVILCHGSPEEVRRMYGKLKVDLKDSSKVRVPDNLQQIVINVARNQKLQLVGDMAQQYNSTGVDSFKDLVLESGAILTSDPLGPPSLCLMKDLSIISNLRPLVHASRQTIPAKEVSKLVVAQTLSEIFQESLLVFLSEDIESEAEVASAIKKYLNGETFEENCTIKLSSESIIDVPSIITLCVSNQPEVLIYLNDNDSISVEYVISPINNLLADTALTAILDIVHMTRYQTNSKQILAFDDTEEQTPVTLAEMRMTSVKSPQKRKYALALKSLAAYLGEHCIIGPEELITFLRRTDSFTSSENEDICLSQGLSIISSLDNIKEYYIDVIAGSVNTRIEIGETGRILVFTRSEEKLPEIPIQIYEEDDPVLETLVQRQERKEKRSQYIDGHLYRPLYEVLEDSNDIYTSAFRLAEVLEFVNVSDRAAIL